ncbi:MAG: hypothetical protein ABDK94_08445 [Atribacterota bacterium]
MEVWVPVVFARIRGAWLHKPLYLDHSRLGLVFILFTVLFGGPLASFRHSEWGWQRGNLGSTLIA